MISASKTTYSHYNLKILRPKVTKNIKNLRKKFCEFRPCLIADYILVYSLNYKHLWRIFMQAKNKLDIVLVKTYT